MESVAVRRKMENDENKSTAGSLDATGTIISSGIRFIFLSSLYVKEIQCLSVKEKMIDLFENSEWYDMRLQVFR
jgi:hypothetical protein